MKKGEAMSTINSVGNNSPVQKVISQPVQKEIAANAPKQIPVTDRLELSGLSHLLKTLKGSDVRTEKVAAIRAQIEKGTYEDDHKLDVATSRLLDDLKL